MKKFLFLFLNIVFMCGLVNAESDRGKHYLPNLDLQLKTAFSVEATVLSGGISEHGDKVLLGYSFADLTVPFVMQLFENNNGSLIPIASLPVDSFISGGGEVDAVGVTKDFSIYSVLDDDLVSTLRLRLFTQNGSDFTLIRQLTFNDNSIQFSAPACFFTNDNKYLALSYQTTASSNAQVITTIKIIDVETFTIVSSIDVPGFSNGLITFGLRDDNYILIGLVNFINNTTFTAPAQIQVYKVKDGQLILKDEAFLPQFPPTYYAFNPINQHSNYTSIIVSTSVALKPNQVSIFDQIGNAQTLLPGDNDNIRFYRFDGKSLRLYAKSRTDTACLVGGFYKDGRTFPYLKGTSNLTVGVPYSLFYGNFFTTTKSGKRGTFTPLNTNFATPPQPFFSNFSDNGKWLIIGGSNLVSGVKNVNFYKVKNH